MPVQVGNTEPPRGVSRLLWRAPLWIFRLGLGGLVRERMLLLHHIGRVSGKPRQNVLEIVEYDSETGSYTVASGFGKKADWIKNLVYDPQVSITVGRKDIPVMARPLSPEDSGDALVRYAKRHPKAAKNLMAICGYKLDGGDEDFFIMGRDIVPFVRFDLR